MEKKLTVCVVVAVALIDARGKVLMQKRRIDRAHGGLWEFPGGKVEPGETTELALIRELDEELGLAISPLALRRAVFASEDPPFGPSGRQHVILFYTCSEWQGEPQCRDAAAIGWFAPAELEHLDMPPLDLPFARFLNSVK